MGCGHHFRLRLIEVAGQPSNEVAYLFHQILRHTSPNHVDHQMLSDAQSKATELCNQVNEGVREKENSDKLEWIQVHVVCDGLPEVCTMSALA